MEVSSARQFLEFTGSFRVAFGTLSGMDTVSVEIRDGNYVGRGECCPMAMYGQTPEGTLADIGRLAPMLQGGQVDRRTLRELLPANAARNAIDCALWDLEAKQLDKTVWELAALQPAEKLLADVSIGICSAAETAEMARSLAAASCIKLKLGGEDDLGCVRAVRDTLPDTPLFVDVNCGWTLQQLNAVAPKLGDLGVFMIEQPLAQGCDEELDGYTGPVPLCADESCHDRSDLPRLRGRYDFINIKLDKTGGLTEALELAQEARQQGFRLMVGCMVATGIALAPAYVVATLCEVIDLDIPLILRDNRANFVRHDGTYLHAFTSENWG